MRGSKRWRVIQTVADHQHTAAVRLEVFDAGYLLRRLQTTLPMRNGKSACDRKHRLTMIAGENMQVESAPAQRIDHVDRIGAQFLGDLNNREASAVPEADNRPLRAICWASRGDGPVGSRRQASTLTRCVSNRRRFTVRESTRRLYSDTLPS